MEKYFQDMLASWIKTRGPYHSKSGRIWAKTTESDHRAIAATIQRETRSRMGKVRDTNALLAMSMQPDPALFWRHMEEWASRQHSRTMLERLDEIALVINDEIIAPTKEHLPSIPSPGKWWRNNYKFVIGAGIVTLAVIGAIIFTNRK